MHARTQSLVDDVTTGDAEWAKLAAIPGFTEPWGDVRDKWRLATEDFSAAVMGALGRKKAEAAEFRAALQVGRRGWQGVGRARQGRAEGGACAELGC